MNADAGPLLQERHADAVQTAMAGPENSTTWLKQSSANPPAGRRRRLRFVQDWLGHANIQNTVNVPDLDHPQ